MHLKTQSITIDDADEQKPHANIIDVFKDNVLKAEPFICFCI